MAVLKEKKAKKARSPGRPGRPLAKKKGPSGTLGRLMQQARLRRSLFNQNDVVAKSKGKLSIGDVRAAENGDPRVSVFLKLCGHLQADPVAIIAAVVSENGN